MEQLGHWTCPAGLDFQNTYYTPVFVPEFQEESNMTEALATKITKDQDSLFKAMDFNSMVKPRNVAHFLYRVGIL